MNNVTLCCNQNCEKPLFSAVKFCPFCGAKQPFVETQAESRSEETSRFREAPVVVPTPVAPPPPRIPETPVVSAPSVVFPPDPPVVAPPSLPPPPPPPPVPPPAPAAAQPVPPPRINNNPSVSPNPPNPAVAPNPASAPSSKMGGVIFVCLILGAVGGYFIINKKDAEKQKEQQAALCQQSLQNANNEKQNNLDTALVSVRSALRQCTAGNLTQAEKLEIEINQLITQKNNAEQTKQLTCQRRLDNVTFLINAANLKKAQETYKEIPTSCKGNELNQLATLLGGEIQKANTLVMEINTLISERSWEPANNLLTTLNAIDITLAADLRKQLDAGIAAEKNDLQQFDEQQRLEEQRQLDEQQNRREPAPNMPSRNVPKPVEINIPIAGLRSKLDAAYQSALNRSSERDFLKSEQESWKKDTQQLCDNDTQCLQKEITKRISVLNNG